MLGEIVCGHCPLTHGCRYRFQGLGAAQIALHAVYRRAASRLLAMYPALGVDEVRGAVDCYIRCPEHGKDQPPAPNRRAWREVA